MEDNEIKHEIDVLEKENQVILAEISDIKSENEWLTKKNIMAWHQQHQRQQNPVPPQCTLAQDVLRRMLRQKKLPPLFLKYVK